MLRLGAATCLILLAAAWAGGCRSPLALEDPGELSPARFELQPGGLRVSAPAPEAPALVEVETRSFRDWSELADYAAEVLGAEPVYDADGEIVGIQGELIQSGEVVFRDTDGTVFADEEFVPAFLGGASGRLRLGEEVLDLQRVDAESSVTLFAQSAEGCIGSDCVSGKSWVTHRLFYHSVGGETKQTSGGTRTVSYECCRSGRLVTVDGRRQCRLLRRGAWEYDPESGRLVPTSPDPFTFTDPQTCSRQTLANRLRIELRLVFGPNQVATLRPKERMNADRVRIHRWQIAAGTDAVGIGEDFINDVVGVCGFHSSTRGGLVRTSDGFTDDDLLCSG